MSFSQTLKTNISETILALEKAALEKWNHGDPSGYVNSSASISRQLTVNELQKQSKYFYQFLNGFIY
jgi:hypothetical protein